MILGDRERRMGSLWNEVPRRRWCNGARSRSGRRRWATVLRISNKTGGTRCGELVGRRWRRYVHEVNGVRRRVGNHIILELLAPDLFLRPVARRHARPPSLPLRELCRTAPFIIHIIQQAPA